MCKGFTTKNSQMKHIGFPTTPRFLRGLVIKGLGWTSIFYVHRRVHHFAPKFKFQPLCKNHASCTFHDGSIGTFRNTVLLWGIGRTCLSLNFTFCKKCVKFLRHEFSSIVGTLHFDFVTNFVLHQRLVLFEFFKRFSFRFQNIDMSFP
jgi:hypothetical protein